MIGLMNRSKWDLYRTCVPGLSLSLTCSSTNVAENCLTVSIPVLSSVPSRDRRQGVPLRVCPLRHSLPCLAPLPMPARSSSAGSHFPAAAVRPVFYDPGHAARGHNSQAESGEVAIVIDD